MTGKTPLDYFNAFKRVLRSASKEGYFRINPSDGVRGKTNASKRLKDFLEPDELISIIDTPIFNPEVREAFVVCCYTGLRWCDIKTLSWSQIKLTKKGSVLVTKIIQADCAEKRGLEDLAEKHITWHSARLTFSILLQDAGVDPATVALLLGHTTTKYVLEVYKRHRPKDQLMHIASISAVRVSDVYPIPG